MTCFTAFLLLTNMNSRMRRGTLIAVAVLGVLVLGTFLLLASGVDKYRPQIESQLQQKLGRPIQLGRLGLRLFPLSLRVEGLTIQENQSFGSSRPFAQSNEVFVSVGLFSLISGHPDAKSVVLDRPKIELIKNQSGQWNFSTLGSSSQTSSSNSEFSLDQLKVNDGQVGYTDLQARQQRAVYDHVDIELAHFAPNKPFDLKAGVHLPGEGKQMFMFDGRLGPLNKNNAALTPVKGKLTLQELRLSGLNQFAPGTVPGGDDAVASGDLDLTSENAKLKGKGTLKLVDAILRGAKLDFPISARYDLDADRTSNLIDIHSSSIGLGQTSFKIDGQYNSGSNPAAVNLHVVNDNSSIAELSRLASAFGVMFDNSFQAKGNLKADLTASGPVTMPQLKGTLNVRDLQVGGGEIKQPVQVPAVDLTFAPDAVRSNSFVAKSGSTQIQTQFTLSKYTTADRSIDATAKTSNANIAELLDMAKAYGFEPSKGSRGTGMMSLDLHVQGPLAKLSSLALAGNAQINGATVETPQLAKPVSIRTANLQFSQNSIAASNVNAAVASIAVNGNISVRNLDAPQLTFALNADKIDTAELQTLTRPSGPAQEKKQTKSANRDTGPSLLQKTTGSGTLSAGTVKAENLVLSNFKASCKLDHGLVTLSPVTTDLFGGKESGLITFDARPASPLVGLNVKLSGVDSNALLTAVSSVKDTLYGSLAADANVKFTLLGSSPDLAKTLNGRLGFNVTNGQLKNVNILNEISKVGKFLKSAPSQNSSDTALKRLAGTLTITNGSASTNDLMAALDAGSLSAQGVINLVNQGLDMKVNAVLAQGTSQAVGGSSIGGYLNTALANNKGELVLPVIVTGTTAHPIFAPDVQALAKMKLSNLVPTLNDPAKLTSGIVGAVSGKQGAGSILNQVLGGNGGNADPKANNPDTKTQDPLKSILGQFGKKKPKNQ